MLFILSLQSVSEKGYVSVLGLGPNKYGSCGFKVSLCEGCGSVIVFVMWLPHFTNQQVFSLVEN